MNIQFDKTTDVSALLTLTLEKADYEANVKKALNDFCKRANMPGFRPGHIPMGLAKKLHGVQAKAEAVNKILNDKLFEYIKENKVQMLGEPMAVEDPTLDIEHQDDLTFKFDIALAPEFKLELGTDDKVDYYDIEVADKQIDEQVDQLRQRGGHPESVETYADRDILRGILAELGEDGAPKEGGLVVENASLMPAYFKNEDEKQKFAGTKKNDVVTFSVSNAYEGNEAEVAALLRIKKEEVAGHSSNFSFQVNEISRFVPAELNQEFFDQVFGEGNVKSESELRDKVKENIARQFEADSDYKFLLDLRAYCNAKVGELQFPDELLKKFMLASNKDKDEKFVEENYDKSIQELKWHLMKEQLVEANHIKVEQDDLKATAIQAARFQFAQYGMQNIPDEYLQQYADEMLKKREQVNGLVERCIDQKLTAALKNVVTLTHKAISLDDFQKLFE